MRTMQSIMKDSISIDEIEKEIEERKVMIGQMVGTLYPSILQDEITKLCVMHAIKVDEINRRNK